MEEELISKCKEGDIQAFEQLYNMYKDKVYNLILRITGSYLDAEDLTQEVFINCFKKIKLLEKETAFSAWLYKLTTNLCIDYIRRKRKKVFTEQLDEEIQTDYTNNSVDKLLLKEDIQQALTKLNYEDRICIILRDIEGLPYEEVAKNLDITLGAVKSRIRRARKRLKELIS